MRRTASELISDVKRNAALPTSQRRLSDDDILQFLNEELTLNLRGELISMREGYFIETETTALVANTSEYAFPTRAIGWKVETVGYTNSSDQYSRLGRISRSQRDMYSSITTTTTPSSYYIKGNSIFLYPSVGASPTGSLTIDFVRIHNDLVLPSTCGAISTVAPVGLDYTCTVDSVPATSSGVDVISGTNPFNVIARNAAASVVGSDVTIAAADFESAPEVGDYICTTGETPIPNVPEDFHSLLALMAAERAHIVMENERGLRLAKLATAERLKYLRDRAVDRVSDAPQKIVPRDYVMDAMRF